MRGFLDMAAWRLSIIDLSELGHQPMSYMDGRYWIAYNGEIYNYQELRDELLARGYRFRSQTDTEVILASYDCWGENCLEKLNGMFAFCLWDNSACKLFVARDRFGIKPLYYYSSSKGIAFASEIKQFFGLPYVQARANLQRVYEFLAYGMLDHSSDTLFEGIKQLRGGTYIHLSLADWSPGQPLTVKTWYELTTPTQYTKSFSDAAEQYRELLSDSVRRELRADVPVGSCLSGGLDSSTIVCLMSNLLKKDRINHVQKVFTSGFELEQFDERKYANEVVVHAGVEPHYIIPKGTKAFESLDKIVYHQDEPFNSMSVFAQWEVFREARANGISVMLDGQGGDEQLGSYTSFFGTHFLGLLGRAKFFQFIRELRAAQALHGLALSTVLGGLAAQYVPPRLDERIRKTVNRPGIPLWLNDEFLRASKVSYTKPWYMKRNGKRESPSQALSRAMITETNLPMLLHWEDRNSMAHSIEARVPFIDHRVMEFALGLPDEFKIHRGKTKRVLRECGKAFLPERIINRTDKMGFVTPEEIWMKHELQENFRDFFHDAVSRHQQLFQKGRLQALFQDTIENRRPFSNLFWRVITFGVWTRIFKVSV